MSSLTANPTVPFAEPRAPQPATAPTTRTWPIFLGLLLFGFLTVWFSREFVKTREVQEILLSGMLDAEGIEQQWALHERMALWSYALSPIFLYIQIAFIALTLQLGLFLAGLEVRFLRLFRVATIAQIVLSVQLAAHIVYRWALTPAEITAETYYRSLGLVSDLVPAASLLPGPILTVASLVSVFELTWYAALYVGLARSSALNRRAAALAVIALCFSFNLLQWAITTYFERLAG